MTWIALFAAAGLETVWALALKRSDGLSRLLPSVIFVVATIGSLALLNYALRSLPVGTAYAIWTGTGAIGTALLAIVFFGESAAVGRLLPIGLIAVGIVWLALVTEG